MGPPNLMIEPRDDALTGLLPLQSNENKLTDTRAALVLMMYMIRIWVIVSKQGTHHASNGCNNRYCEMKNGDEVSRFSHFAVRQDKEVC